MNKINAVYVSLAALVVAIVALVMCIVCCSKDSTVNVEEVINEKPEIIINAMQNYEQKVREEAQKKAQEMIMSNIEDLNNNPNDGVLGNPDGKVVVVEFFDFSCGYCHRKAALAAKEQGKYAEVYSALFEIKGPLTEAKIDEAAVLAGVDLEKMKTDMNSEKVNKALQDIADLASKIQVNGVPTLVVNGKVVQTLDEAVIQREIEAARSK